MELDATKFKDGDRINHFLVNALMQLTAEERNILAKNLLERSVAPPHEDKGAEEEVWVKEIRNRAIQECIDCFNDMFLVSPSDTVEVAKQMKESYNKMVKLKT